MKEDGWSGGGWGAPKKIEPLARGLLKFQLRVSISSSRPLVILNKLSLIKQTYRLIKILKICRNSSTEVQKLEIHTVLDPFALAEELSEAGRTGRL